jgi:hypothetical protein
MLVSMIHPSRLLSLSGIFLLLFFFLEITICHAADGFADRRFDFRTLGAVINPTYKSRKGNNMHELNHEEVLVIAGATGSATDVINGAASGATIGSAIGGALGGPVGSALGNVAGAFYGGFSAFFA